MFYFLQNPAWMLIKTSVLIFYLKVFRTSRLSMWISIATLIIICLSGIVFTFLNLFRCRPASSAWKPTAADRSTQCINIVALNLSSTPIDLVTSLVIFFVPIRIISHLHLPNREKAVVVTLFALGAFVIAVSVVRIAVLEDVVLIQLRNADAIQNGQGSQVPVDDDWSYNASLSYMWSAVEVHVGIICACIPTLKPLFSRSIPWISRKFRRPIYRSNSTLFQFHLVQTSSPPTASDLSAIGSERASAAKETRIQHAGPELSASRSCPADMDYFIGSTSDRYSAQSEWTTSAGATSIPCIYPESTINCDHRRAQSLPRLTVKQSYVPIAIVTLLSLLSGIVYGWITVLNGHVQAILHATEIRTIQLQAATYTGWFVGSACVAQFVLSKFGFRVTMITGLFVFACGTLMIWPSAVLLSTGGFFISDFVVGCGLSIMESASDPFIMLCGPAKYALVRFLFSSVIARTGGVVSAIVASKLLVKGGASAVSLEDTQWTYLGLALFVLAFAAFLTYWPLPEVSDEELESDAAYIKGERLTFEAVGKRYVCRWEIVYVTYSLGLLSSICFQGAQSVIGVFSSDYVRSVAPKSELSAVYIDWLGRTAAVVGRFLALIGCLFTRPSWVFLAFYVGLLLVSILSLIVKREAGIVVIILIQLFGAPMWPFQFVMSLTGFGRATKLASTVLVSTVGAAAVFPAITFAAQKHGTDADHVQASFRVMLACTCLGIVMPLFISLSTTARKQIHHP